MRSSDAVFVRARRADVHPLVRDPARHPGWWPGLEAVEGGGGWVGLAHHPPGAPAPALRLDVRVTKDRPGDRGVHLACRGAFVGRAEWYYLDEPDGTVVHHVLDADTRARGARRRLRRYRRSVRAGLVALKDALEGTRTPGAEPDAALVAHQREAARQLLPPSARGAAP